MPPAGCSIAIIPTGKRVREQRKAHRLARLVAALPKIRRNVSAQPVRRRADPRIRAGRGHRADRAHAIRPATNPTPGSTAPAGHHAAEANVVLEDDCVVLTSRPRAARPCARMRRRPSWCAPSHLRDLPGKRMFQFQGRCQQRPHRNTTQVNGSCARSRHQDIAEGFPYLMASAWCWNRCRADFAGGQRPRPQEAGAGSRARAADELSNTPAICRKSYVHDTIVTPSRTASGAFLRRHEGLSFAVETRAAAGAGGRDAAA